MDQNQLARWIERTKAELRAYGLSQETIEGLWQAVTELAQTSVYRHDALWDAAQLYAQGNEDVLARIKTDMAFSSYMQATGQNPGYALLRAPIDSFYPHGDRKEDNYE